MKVDEEEREIWPKKMKSWMKERKRERERGQTQPIWSFPQKEKDYVGGQKTSFNREHEYLSSLVFLFCFWSSG